MEKSNSYGILSSLFLLLAFLLCSTFTILIGSRVYENIRADNNASFYSDAAVNYVTDKVRRVDRAGSVEVREINGCSVPVLSSSTNGLQCKTWIYTLNSVLEELYAEGDSGLTVEDGPDIMECTPLDFTLQRATDQLTIHLETEPSDVTARLPLRSESEGGTES